MSWFGRKTNRELEKLVQDDNLNTGTNSNDNSIKPRGKLFRNFAGSLTAYLLAGSLALGYANKAEPNELENTKIVFSAALSLLTVRPDGSDLDTIITNMEYNLGDYIAYHRFNFAEWFPNGEQIGFVTDSRSHLYYCNSDGTEIVDTGVEGVRGFTFTPDGKNIVISGTGIYNGSIYDLYLFDILTSNIRRITNNSVGIANYSPAISRTSLDWVYTINHGGNGLYGKDYI